MNKALTYILCVVFLKSLLLPTYASSDEVFFTKPICSNYEYLIPITSLSGAKLQSKPQNVYCSNQDIHRNESQPHRVKMLSLLKRDDVKKISIYAFTFNDEDMAEAICSAYKEHGVEVKLFLTNIKSKDGTIVPVSNSSTRDLIKCFGKGSNALQYIGHSGGVLSFHPKLYIVEFKNSEYVSVFGSGHVGNGMTINFDHWLFHYGEIGDELWSYNECLGNTINNMLAEQKGLLGAFPFFQSCHSGFDGPKKIKPYSLPFERNEFLKELKNITRNSIRINIAMFSFDSKHMLLAILDALSKGSKVKLILDDDVYWADRYNCTSCMAKSSSYQSVVKVLQEWGAEVQFLQTNHHDNGNIMHHKFMIIESEEGSHLIMGSANFTKAALGAISEESNIGNVENSYLIHDKKIINDFESEFTRMWGLSSSEMEMPKSTDPHYFK